MKYKTKVIVNDVVMTSDTSDSQPYITNVKLADSVAQKVFAFGATGSSELKFTVVNPSDANFDGAEVEFWVSPQDEGVYSTYEEILDAVGSTQDSEYLVDENEIYTDNEEDDGSAGDTMTEAEITEAETEEAADEENAFTLLYGEDEETSAVTTEEEEEPEWFQVGVFYVYKQTKNNGQINVICYDGFSLMTDIYTPTTATDTISNIYADYCAQVLLEYGIVVDSDYPMPAGTITWNESISFRDAIGRFASLCGGYADFDEEGNLNINNFVNSDVIVTTSDLFSNTESSGGDVVLTGLACNGLVAGEIATVSFDNPYMTQTILDGILAEYVGVRVSGRGISLMWTPSTIAGTFVRVMTDEECEAYLKMVNYAEAEGYDDDLVTSLNAFGSIIQIVSQVVDFNGDAIATINSGLSTFAEVDNPSPTPVKTTAEESAKTATSYITDIDEENGIKVSAKDNANNYVQIDSDGMSIYKDESGTATEVAEFLGDKIAMYNSDGMEQFLIESGETSTQVTERGKVSYFVEDGTINKTVSTKYAIGTFTEVKVKHRWGASAPGLVGEATATLTQASPTVELMYYGNVIGRITLQSVGGNSFVLKIYAATGGAWVNVNYLEFKYLTSSTTVSKIALGSYPNETSDMLIKVGNGTGTAARSNSFAVDWQGNLYLSGDVFANCNGDSTNGQNIAFAHVISNSWKCIKYADGVYEAWRTYETNSTTLTNATDGAYSYSSWSEINAPTFALSTDHVTATCRNAGRFVSAYTAGSRTVNFKIYACAAVTNSQAYKVDLHIRGTWY